MTRAGWTKEGLVVEGALRLVAEDDLVLVLVGEEFLDDVLRERFPSAVRMDARTGGMSMELGYARLTVERMAEGQEGGGTKPNRRREKESAVPSEDAEGVRKGD